MWFEKEIFTILWKNPHESLNKAACFSFVFVLFNKASAVEECDATKAVYLF
jgi:hypothetical protein